jgi:hypothetical protein
LYDNELAALGPDATPATASGVAPVPLAATRDAVSTLCGNQDLRLSTAALLAARFPFVSPTGALPVCGAPGRFTYLVDGGLVESSGASPVTGMLRDLLPRIQAYNRDSSHPCVQPVVVQLDNDYEMLSVTDPPSRPRELLAPVMGLGRSGERGAAARQQLAQLGNAMKDLAGCSAAPDLPTYLHVRPTAHPGTQAPLGWSLSSEARRDLRTSFASNENQCALLTARRWMTGIANGTTCIAGRATSSDGRAVANQTVCLAPLADAAAPCSTSGPVTRTDAGGGFELLAPSSTIENYAVRVGGATSPITRGSGDAATLVRALRLTAPAGAPLAISSRGDGLGALLAVAVALLLVVATVVRASRSFDRRVERGMLGA